ncbi:hypothetical protein J4Q44_G00221610 [Coregonus suidteri]|uniref:Uncharacterized protein n=1 Tax=Coregonus suidteri TaxID=861788 RepID=A0AAN8LC00_9TELE
MAGLEKVPSSGCLSFREALLLKLELKKIREQQDMLFCFMNFLTQEGAVHVLQFCLTMVAEGLMPGW